MDKTITIKRTVKAPRERVFKACITPEDLMQWYSPGGGWTIPYAEVDAKAGGRFGIGFRGPDGKEGFDFTGTYNEVIPPERIAYTLDDGRLASITLEDADGATDITVVFAMETINSEEQQRQGWTAQVDHLKEYLEGTASN